MKITLKRALKLRKEIEALLAKVELPLSTTIPLLINRDPKEIINAGSINLDIKLGEYFNLSTILSSIRTQMATMNVSGGVEDILADIADIDRRITIYRKIAAASETPTFDLLDAEMKLAKKALESSDDRGYGRPAREITTSVVTNGLREFAVSSIAELKRRREAKEDERTAKNASMTIEIGEGYAELLQKLGLL